ncbi:MAG TPA: tRNA lysidine(34) synthetase TilS [Alphaproteobacteria bacterium]
MSASPPPLANPPAAALGAAEFAAAMAALGPWEPAPRLAAAVSGGADSLALAFLADAWTRDRGGSLLCLIVDHGLRAESGAEAEQVRGALVARGLEARILRSPAASGARGSIQERARRLRYTLLIEHCREARIAHLLLAHHRDDQAETVLMRLVRGSGLRGLAGMAPASLAPASGGHVRLLRPLLASPKARLRATLEALRQAWVEDPSNRDARHERVRWRALMPLLASGGADPGRLAAAAGRLADDRLALDRAAATWLTEAASPSRYGHVILRMEGFGGIAPSVAEAALARVLGAVGGGAYPPPRDSVTRLGAALRRAPDRMARTLAGCVLTFERGRLLVTREDRAVVETCPARPGLLLWDGRFELRLDGSAERLGGITIARLGREGLAEARLLLRGTGGRLPQAPARQLWSLPALWQGRRLVEVPHLPGLSGEKMLASVAWAPRQPLTG